jgi:hypothetical protein
VSEPASELKGRTQAIDDRLEEMARAVIRGHLDLSRPENSSFLAYPDARDQHQTQWHQWGILTHTRMFLRHYDQDIPQYLREWGVYEQVDEILRRCIDGASRWELLRAAILLHDIGKFSARTRGQKRFHFAHHEEQSGDIIRDELDLHSLGFTAAQTDYIAQTAQDHFVLGLVRKAARARGQYDETMPFTEIFRSLSLQIKAEHPDDFVEIGVLFLGDSLAKVDPASGPERAVSQYDVNILVAREYLRIVLGSAPPGQFP